MSKARVKVSLVDGTIEVEGDESFVNAQLDRFGDAIRARFAPADQKPVGPADEVDLTGIFAATDGGGVQIMTAIPGRNRRQQMASAARLLAYAAERIQKRRTVPITNLIAACKAQRCYDPRNLSTRLRNQQYAFIVTGKRRRRVLSLTDSGRQEAETLVKMLAPPRKTQE